MRINGWKCYANGGMDSGSFLCISTWKFRSSICLGLENLNKNKSIKWCGNSCYDASNFQVDLDMILQVVHKLIKLTIIWNLLDKLTYQRYTDESMINKFNMGGMTIKLIIKSKSIYANGFRIYGLRKRRWNWHYDET